MCSVCLRGQNVPCLLFYDYDTVIKEIKQNLNNRQITDKYDLVSMLVLDASELKTIIKIAPNIIDEYNDYCSALSKKNNHTVFQTDEKDIKQIFRNDSNVKRLKKCLFRETEMAIHFPIYIKDNKAIFYSYHNSWSATYFAELEKGKLVIVKLVEGID